MRRTLTGLLTAAALLVPTAAIAQEAPQASDVAVERIQQVPASDTARAKLAPPVVVDEDLPLITPFGSSWS